MACFWWHLNKCRFVIRCVPCHWPDSNFKETVQGIYPWYEFENDKLKLHPYVPESNEFKHALVGRAALGSVSIKRDLHYSDVIMNAVACPITSLRIVNPTDYSGADQRTHQSSASLAFVGGIHRGPVHSPRKGPVTRKMFPFDDVIICPGMGAGVRSTRASWLATVGCSRSGLPYGPGRIVMGS